MKLPKYTVKPIASANLFTCLDQNDNVIQVPIEQIPKTDTIDPYGYKLHIQATSMDGIAFTAVIPKLEGETLATGDGIFIKFPTLSPLSDTQITLAIEAEGTQWPIVVDVDPFTDTMASGKYAILGWMTNKWEVITVSGLSEASFDSRITDLEVLEVVNSARIDAVEDKTQHTNSSGVTPSEYIYDDTLTDTIANIVNDHDDRILINEDAIDAIETTLSKPIADKIKILTNPALDCSLYNQFYYTCGALDYFTLTGMQYGVYYSITMTGGSLAAAPFLGETIYWEEGIDAFGYDAAKLNKISWYLQPAFDAVAEHIIAVFSQTTI